MTSNIRRWGVNRPLALCLVFLFVVPYLPARVSHVEVTSRTDVLNAQPFGRIGRARNRKQWSFSSYSPKGTD